MNPSEYGDLMIHTQEQLLKWLDESPDVRPCVKRALDQGGARVLSRGDKWYVITWLYRHEYQLTIFPSKKPEGYGKYIVVEDMEHGRA
jgi:hypothetical protein